MVFIDLERKDFHVKLRWKDTETYNEVISEYLKEGYLAYNSFGTTERSDKVINKITRYCIIEFTDINHPSVRAIQFLAELLKSHRGS